jgi:putative lipoprotein
MPSAVALVAGGNEPFWRIEMASDSVALLSRPEEGTQSISVGNLRQDIEGVVLTGTVEGGGTVFLEATTGTCQDSMSGALTHATAVFTIDGRRLRGCAWFGTALDPDVTPAG